MLFHHFLFQHNFQHLLAGGAAAVRHTDQLHARDRLEAGDVFDAGVATGADETDAYGLKAH